MKKKLTVIVKLMKRNLYICCIYLLHVPKMLDKVLIDLCKSLPLDFTICEKDGFCERPNEHCDYCRRINSDAYLCNKKTYTRIQESQC